MTWQGTGVTDAGLPEGSPREVLLGSRSVLLVRVEGAVYAIDGVCPHLGGALGEGRLDGCRLTCPLHEATFDVTTGAVVTDPFGLVPPEGGVAPVESFAMRVRNGAFEVDVLDGPPP
ncbi:MAG: Rieske 2Fe-2S domain-containing protein [Thermoplasmata archaeon]